MYSNRAATKQNIFYSNLFQIYCNKEKNYVVFQVRLEVSNLECCKDMFMVVGNNIRTIYIYI